MKAFATLSKPELTALQSALLNEYNAVKALQLKLDMSRGKPAADQLDLSMPVLEAIQGAAGSELFSKTGADTRNYGDLAGLMEAREFVAELMEAEVSEVICGGNSSLTLMFDLVSRAMLKGVYGGSKPWGEQGEISFLCPVPGYDRHFAITEYFGIKMIPVPMDESGPDMEMVERLVGTDASIKGIWCVPKYSNPDGVVYSDETVRRFANLSPKADDFRIFWDNAYVVHHLYDEKIELLNLRAECKKAGNPHMVYELMSTSKITFPGGGFSAMLMSVENVQHELKLMGIQAIGPDKINQLRHVRYFQNAAGVEKHMERLAESLRPKFGLVEETFAKELAGLGIATWTKPMGGYFVSFDGPPGSAKRIVSLCKEAGVVLTGAGATHPYGIDPEDKNIRIAPTYPPLQELEKALSVFCICAKLAAVELLLGA